MESDAFFIITSSDSALSVSGRLLPGVLCSSPVPPAPPFGSGFGGGKKSQSTVTIMAAVISPPMDKRSASLRGLTHQSLIIGQRLKERPILLVLSLRSGYPVEEGIARSCKDTTISKTYSHYQPDVFRFIFSHNRHQLYQVPYQIIRFGPFPIVSVT